MKIPRKIYILWNLVTNKVYVGSSSNTKMRFKIHINALRAGTHPIEDLQDDFNKYGEMILFSIVDTIEEYSEKGKEYEWMEKYKSYNRKIGYNYKDKHLFKGKATKGATNT